MDAIKRAAQTVTHGTKDVARWLREEQKCTFGVFECHKKECSITEIVLPRNNQIDEPNRGTKNTQPYRLPSEHSEIDEEDIDTDELHGQADVVRESANSVPETDQCFCEPDGLIPKGIFGFSLEESEKEPMKDSFIASKPFVGTAANNANELGKRTIASRDRNSLNGSSLNNEVASRGRECGLGFKDGAAMHTPSLSTRHTTSQTPSAHLKSSEDGNCEVVSSSIKDRCESPKAGSTIAGLKPRKGENDSLSTRPITPGKRQEIRATLWHVISRAVSKSRHPIKVVDRIAIKPGELIVRHKMKKGNIVFFEEGFLAKQSTGETLLEQFKTQMKADIEPNSSLRTIVFRCKSLMEQHGERWIQLQKIVPFPSSQNLLDAVEGNEADEDKVGLWSIPGTWFKRYAASEVPDTRDGYNAMLMFRDQYLIIVALRDLKQNDRIVLARVSAAESCRILNKILNVEDVFPIATNEENVGMPPISPGSAAEFLRSLDAADTYLGVGNEENFGYPFKSSLSAAESVPLRHENPVFEDGFLEVAEEEHLGYSSKSPGAATIIKRNRENTNETEQNLGSIKTPGFAATEQITSRKIMTRIAILLRNPADDGLIENLRNYICALEREKAKPNVWIISELTRINSENEGMKKAQMDHLISRFNALLN